jgi:hypothetical protein
MATKNQVQLKLINEKTEVKQNEIKKMVKESGLRFSKDALAKLDNNLNNVLQQALVTIARTVAVKHAKVVKLEDVDFAFLARERMKSPVAVPVEKKPDQAPKPEISKDEIIKELRQEYKQDLDKFKSEMLAQLKGMMPIPPSDVKPSVQPATQPVKAVIVKKETKITALKDVVPGAIPLMEVKAVFELPEKVVNGKPTKQLIIRDESLEEGTSGCILDLWGEDVAKYHKGDMLRLSFCFIKVRDTTQVKNQKFITRGTNGEIEKI